MEIIYDTEVEPFYGADLYEASELLDRFTATATVKINYNSDEPYCIIVERD